MNTMEKMLATIKGEAKPRGFLCIPLVFAYAAAFRGIKIKDYLQNGELMAKCQLESRKFFQYDAVFVYGDNSLDAEALGCKLYYPENDYPYVTRPIFPKLPDIRDLPLINPLEAGRMPEMIKACSILRDEVKNELPVIGCVVGPASIAGQLTGLDQLLFLLADEPANFKNLLRQTFYICRDYGKALIQAGASVIVIMEPTASQNILPPRVFQEFIAPLLKELFSEFKQEGVAVTWLMITGRSKHILPHYKKCGVDMATIDYEVSLEESIKTAPELVLAGNIKPLALVNLSPDEIAKECENLLKIGHKGKDFILSTGCEVPLDAKPDNIETMVMQARSSNVNG